MLTVTIDGADIRVEPGTTVLAATQSLGIELPAACSDPRLNPVGACRLCLVHIEGLAKPQAACTLPVSDGMRVQTSTPELEAERKALLGMLAKGYPSEWIDRLPDKPFHRWLKRYGLVDTASTDQSVGQIDESNPYFRFDPNACIDCFRCVRICEEVQGSDVWHMLGRGKAQWLATDNLKPLAMSACRSCGACADACPTGALVDKTLISLGQPDTWTRTTCPYCGVGCEMNVGVRNGRIVQVLPTMDAPVNKGHLCVKGRYAHQYVHAPDRLTTPLIRKDGRLEPATWDEAISFVARELQAIKEKYGADSIGVLGSARAPNEDNYLAQKFARVVIGTNNVDSCARVCHGPTASAMKALLGTGAATNSFNDIEIATCFLVAGANPTENHPVVGERILQRVRAGAKLVVIDPRKTDLAAIANVHLQIRPGTNVPALSAIAQVILEEDLVDHEFLSLRVENADVFREFVRDWTPERAAEICGVDPNSIREAARLYATSRPSMAFHGLGMTEHLQGTEGVMSLVNLALLTGNIGKPGAGINPLRGQNNVQGSAHMGCEPSNLTGYVAIPENAARFEAVWGTAVPRQKGRNLIEMIDAAHSGDLHALWAIGYDVYLTNADANATHSAFESIDLIIIQDLFLNETAREFAHVVFPASSSFERSGTFMNAERRVQRVRKAVESPGDAKPDWEIIQLVAQKMGHPNGFEFDSAESIWNEIRKLWKPGAGMSLERLEVQGLQWPCTDEQHPGTTILHRDRFPHGQRTSLRCIPYVPTLETVSDDFPFLLNTGRTLAQFNAGTMTGRTKNMQIRPTDTVDIHPDDAQRLAVSEGDSLKIVSRYGEAILPVRVDPRVRKGELFATFHSPQLFLNRTTSSVRDRITGAPEYKVTAVRLEPVTANH